MPNVVPTWLLVVVCVSCWGAWGVVEKLATKHVSPMMMQVIGAYAYSAVAPVVFIYMKASGTKSEWNPSGVLWTTLACALAVTASLSFCTAIQRTHVHLVVGFSAVYPLVTFVLCALFLGEPVTLQKFVGIIAIICGAVMLSV